MINKYIKESLEEFEALRNQYHEEGKKIKDNGFLVDNGDRVFVDDELIYKWLKQKLTQLAEKMEKYEDALIWCSGSEDFQIGGKARKGWEKLCLPLIDDIKSNLK